MEFVSPEGLRLDGRRPKELRRLACELGCLPHADGSAQLQMGNTKVGAHHLCFLLFPSQSLTILSGPQLVTIIVSKSLKLSACDSSQLRSSIIFLFIVFSQCNE